MKITERKTILRETVECNTSLEATETILRYQRTGWRIASSWMENDKWYYEFEKETKEQ